MWFQARLTSVSSYVLNSERGIPCAVKLLLFKLFRKFEDLGRWKGSFCFCSQTLVSIKWFLYLFGSSDRCSVSQMQRVQSVGILEIPRFCGGWWLKHFWKSQSVWVGFRLICCPNLPLSFLFIKHLSFFSIVSWIHIYILAVCLPASVVWNLSGHCNKFEIWCARKRFTGYLHSIP